VPQAADVGASVLIFRFGFFRVDFLGFWLSAFYLACVAQFALHAISNQTLATIEINCITALLCDRMHALWLALKLLVRVIF